MTGAELGGTLSRTLNLEGMGQIHRGGLGSRLEAAQSGVQL